MTWHQVVLPYACFGICEDNNIVIQAAPIARWMIGKPFTYVQQWIKSKKGYLR